MWVYNEGTLGLPLKREFKTEIERREYYRKIEASRSSHTDGSVSFFPLTTGCVWVSIIWRHQKQLAFYFQIIINLLAQKQDRVTRATQQNEQDSKDTDATNSCPARNVQVKTIL